MSMHRDRLCQRVATGHVRELRYVMPVWRKSFSPNSLPEQLFCKMFGALEKTPYLCIRN